MPDKPTLNDLLAEYKEAAVDCNAYGRLINKGIIKDMDAEEYLALVDARNAAAQLVAKEILRLLEKGEAVHITDIPTLRQALGEVQ